MAEQSKKIAALCLCAILGGLMVSGGTVSASGGDDGYYQNPSTESGGAYSRSGQSEPYCDQAYDRTQSTIYYDPDIPVSHYNPDIPTNRYNPDRPTNRYNPDRPSRTPSQ